MARAVHRKPPAPSAAEAIATDTRSRLLVTARDLFLERGAASFSLREVARRVGLSAAGVYRHFDGKEALLGAACQQGFGIFSSYLVRALGADNPRARLLAAAEQYRLFALENPQDYRFIFMSVADEVMTKPPADADPAGAGPPHSTFRFLVDRVRECMDDQVLGRGDAEQVAVIVWAHLHGLVSLRLSGHLAPVGDEPAFAAFYRASLGRLLDGLAD